MQVVAALLLSPQRAWCTAMYPQHSITP